MNVGLLGAGRAATAAHEVGGGYETFEGVIGAGLGAAVVAAATTEHAALIGACLDAGLPVFCENPIAVDCEETEAVANRAEFSGAVVQMGFQGRFDAGYGEAKRLIDDGTLGTLYSPRLTAHDTDPPHEGFIPGPGHIRGPLHTRPGHPAMVDRHRGRRDVRPRERWQALRVREVRRPPHRSRSDTDNRRHGRSPDDG